MQSDMEQKIEFLSLEENKKLFEKKKRQSEKKLYELKKSNNASFNYTETSKIPLKEAESQIPLIDFPLVYQTHS